MYRIKLLNINKAFKKYSAPWLRLIDWIFPSRHLRFTENWVLRDINLCIEEGTTVGLVGINGAGKSTLLKMIAGAVEPSSGEIQIRGKIIAILELGMGFHPDFTGRQNVYMAGSLLGYSSRELELLMPEIEVFAEIGEYIDMPVRTYSSGMQMRLAFSVATVRSPDILIIDEALSVGDIYFQHKSFNRIKEFAQKGATLIIVSHDKTTIQALCDRVILLSESKIIMDDRPEAVMDYYNALLAHQQEQTITQENIDGKLITKSGTGEAEVTDIKLLNSKNEVIQEVAVGEFVKLIATIKVNKNIERLVFGYGIKNKLGLVAYGTNTDLQDMAVYNLLSGETLQFEIEFYALLGVGSYSVQTALTSTDTHLVNNYEWRDISLIFNVVNVDKKRFEGLVWIEPNIRIHRNK